MKTSPATFAAVVVLAAGCTSFFVGPDAPLDRGGLLDQVWLDVDRHYALFGTKNVDWDSLHGPYRTRAAEAANDSVLADAIGSMLAELHDLHVSISAGAWYYRYTGFDRRPAFFDPAVVAEYVTDRGGSPNGHMAFGHAAPDIGYIWILHFKGAGFSADIDTALARLADVRGLIVDVRDNLGGDLSNSITVAGRFADRDRTFAFRRFRDGPAHGDLSSPDPLVLSPLGPRRFDGPVAVLTNRRTISAAEAFVLAVRALPSVTIVGDSTAGGSGNTFGRELPNGWSYKFPIASLYDEGQKPFEEVGLAPDVWVRGSSAELVAGRDVPLDTALAVIRRAPP